MHASKRIIPLFLLALLCMHLFLNFSYAPTPYVSGSNLNLLISENKELAFQNDHEHYVLLTCTTGNLNSSTNSISVDDGGGTFRFLSNETCTLRVTFNVTNVNVEGDEGNEARFVDSGDSVNIGSGDSVIIYWNIHVEAWLPLLFIIGLTGIVSMIGGAMYGVNEIKKRHYENGFVTGTIFIAVGFAFVLAWLWG